MAISYDKKTHELVFSSGHRLYAHANIIGLGPGNDVHDGYDGTISWPQEEWEKGELSREDMLELTDMMIARWQAFKETL